MATSTITLYSTKILENENFIIDEIDSYLFLNGNGVAHQDSQFIKNGLDIVIKLSDNAFNWDDSQAVAYNYCRIINKDGNTTNRACYYFIREVKWLAQHTIQLTLHMDVLNTFKSGVHYTISNRTLITREHKNRFYKQITGLNTFSYFYDIDIYPEGINPKLVRYGDNLTKLHDNISRINPNFYLIYKNSKENSEDADNVVNCYLACDLPFRVVSSFITIEYLRNLGFSYFYFSQMQSASVPTNLEFYGEAVLLPTRKITFSNIGDTLQGGMFEAYIEPDQTSIRIKGYRYDSNDMNEVPIDETPLYKTQRIRIPQGTKFYATNTNSYTRGNVLIQSNERTFNETPVVDITTPYNDINKTDSRIIKIIKLPYAVTSGFSYNLLTNQLEFDDSIWEIDDEEHLLKLVDLSKDFYQDNIIDSKLDIFPINDKDHPPFTNESTFSLTALRDTALEPKLYHSEFYQIKYFYDSFSKNINLEDLNIPVFTYTTPSDLKIGFKMTKTINSRFMFYFDAFPKKYSDEDIDKALIVQRNNEEVIYSSPYINYLRSGFNYDVKAKNRTEAFSWFTAGVGIVGGALSLAFGSKTLGAGLIASSVMSIGSAIKTTVQAEQNLEAKLHALKWQANSVYGADDVDLMSKYCDNKLIRTIYKCSPRMEQLVKDLFFYTGYIENRMGVPDVTTRKWFNFLQCDIKFETTKNIPLDCLEEMSAKFKGGVTYFHRNQVSNVYRWDIERQYENWESMFF